MKKLLFLGAFLCASFAAFAQIPKQPSQEPGDEPLCKRADLTPTGLKKGASVIQVTIKNLVAPEGGGAASNSFIVLAKFEYTASSAADVTKTVSVSSIPKGGSKIVEVPIPSHILGGFKVTVDVDSDDSVNECNESNNRKSTSF